MRRLQPALTASFEAFLDAHQQETFYVFAFDFDLGCAAVYLSANTEPLFDDTLSRYQQGPRADWYHSDAGRQSLRYNCGDWGYAAFEELEVLSLAECEKIPESWDTFESDMLDALTGLLLQLRTTDSFARMRRSPDFTSFCIGHDEHYTEAFDRMARIQAKLTGS